MFCLCRVSPCLLPACLACLSPFVRVYPLPLLHPPCPPPVHLPPSLPPSPSLCHCCDATTKVPRFLLSLTKVAMSPSPDDDDAPMNAAEVVEIVAREAGLSPSLTATAAKAAAAAAAAGEVSLSSSCRVPTIAMLRTAIIFMLNLCCCPGDSRVRICLALAFTSLWNMLVGSVERLLLCVLFVLARWACGAVRCVSCSPWL